MLAACITDPDEVYPPDEGGDGSGNTNGSVEVPLSGLTTDSPQPTTGDVTCHLPVRSANCKP
jgi:hypothetical protein